MALDTTAHDIYRGTSGITLPTDISNEIWAKAQEASVIMRVSPRITLPGRGLSIPVITGDPTATIVAEATEKPVSNSTFATKTMTPYKIAVIETFSNEFRRDLPRLYDELVRRLPAAIGKAFDGYVFGSSSVGTGFDILGGVDAVALDASGKTVYEQLLAALETVANYGGTLDTWVLSPQGEVALLAETDQVGRPLFSTSIADASIGRILGAEVYRSGSVYKAGTTSPAVADVLGFAGDFSQTRWGMVEGIEMAISDQATVNDGSKQLNLWQRNMFAVRVEAEVSFVSNADSNSKKPIVRLTRAHS